MKLFISRFPKLAFLFSLIAALSYPLPSFAEMVSCPASLTWQFSGKCSRKMAPNEAKCPAPSRMEKNSVAGPALCIAEGRCLGGGVPDAKGVCIEKEIKPEKTRRFQQKDNV